MSRRLKSILQNLLVLLVGLASAEILLALATRVSPVAHFYLETDDYKSAIPDPILGHRGNPHHWDRDANGYRNARVLDEADIVALGDSHTAGTGVNREAAWPHLLAESLGSSQYNMGFGGYGPTHSLLQLDAALSLAPKLVLIGLYFENDFIDAYEHMSINSELRALSTPSLAAEAEQHDRNHEMRDGLTVSPADAPASEDGRAVLRSVRLYNALRHIQKRRAKLSAETSVHFRRFGDAVDTILEKKTEGYSIFEGERWRTIFTIPRRLQALDDSDPRVRLGFELAVAALLRIEARLSAAGIPMCLILLPTKELVFADEVDDLARYEDLATLVAGEVRLKALLVAAMQREAIPVVDVLADLRSAGAQPYWENANGHPNHEGQQVIAQSVRTCAESALGGG